jgi:muconolactone D-isomerase
MEFLVEIEIAFPPHFTTEQRDDLITQERVRGRTLAAEGTLRAIWRVPGQFANRAIWSAPDATELHKSISSLPLWPYAKVKVTALAQHDLAPDCLGIPASLTLHSPE